MLLMSLAIAWVANSGSTGWLAVAPSGLALIAASIALALARAEKKRFTLGMAAFAVAAVAILLAELMNDLEQGQLTIWIDVEAENGDPAAMARELLSPAVVDDALESGLSALPRFAGRGDAGEALRRAVSVQVPPGSRVVRLSIGSHSSHDELIVFHQLLLSRDKRLGLGPRWRASQASGVHAMSRYPSFQPSWLALAWDGWFLGFWWMFHRRRRRVHVSF
jgi:hypothetical protein